MDLQQTLANQTATDAGAESTQGQAQERVYSQKEVDDMMAKTRSAVERKATKPYAELGSPEELRQIKEQYEAKRFEEQKGKGEFENILKELASKKDAEIARRDQIIAQYRVDAPLLETAAKYRSVNPEQVKSLLKNQVRLSNDGDVEVVDNNGTTRYNDRGEPLTVEELVAGFLQTNPHFVSAGPSTTQTKSSMGTQQANSPIDPSKLDMKNPADRKLYQDWRQSQGRR